MKAACILLSSILITLSFIGIAAADLAPNYSGLPPTADMNPPAITIMVPEEKQVFEAGTEVPYCIAIRAPDSWFDTPQIHGNVRGVGYVLDGQRVVIASIEGEGARTYVPTPYFTSENRTVYLKGNLTNLCGTNLYAGEHAIKVWLHWESFYHPENYSADYYGYWLACFTVSGPSVESNIQYFKVVNSSVEVNSQTKPNPSITPTISIEEPHVNDGGNSASIILVGTTGLIAIMWSLVFYKKHRKSDRKKSP